MISTGKRQICTHMLFSLTFKHRLLDDYVQRFFTLELSDCGP